MAPIGLNLNTYTPVSTGNAPAVTPTSADVGGTGGNSNLTIDSKTYTPTAPGTDSVTGSNDGPSSENTIKPYVYSFESLNAQDKKIAKQEAEAIVNAENAANEKEREVAALRKEIEKFKMRRNEAIARNMLDSFEQNLKAREDSLKRLKQEALNLSMEAMRKEAFFQDKWHFSYTEALEL